MKKLRFKYLAFTLIASFLVACSCSKNNDSDNDTNGNGNQIPGFYFGVDLSYVNQVEDKGGVYKENGTVVDPYINLKKHGANLVRVRIWNNPNWIKNIYGSNTILYSGYKDVEKSIQRAKNAGMDVLLNFHYSDTWADPGYQKVPEAWKNITSINILQDSVYNFTYSVLKKLKLKNLSPKMVQIGNETNCGMMINEVNSSFPKLNVCDGEWSNFGKIINSAINAIKQIDREGGTKTKIVLHVADPKNLDWWMSGIKNQGGVTGYDIMGFSYYHIWHNTIGFSELTNHIKGIKTKHGKDLIVLETAYPFTTANNDNYPNIYFSQTPLAGYPYSFEGQKNFMISLTQKMIDAGANGVIYWEPAWITSNLTDLWNKGSSWENCAFYNFSGNLTTTVEYFNHKYTRK